MDLDTRQFRNALGCFATGVTVVTAQLPGEEAVGLTANSFSSVSLDPPLVLWCLDKSSDTLPTFSACAHFAINVLKEEQRDISALLARQGAHTLDGLAVRQGKTGVPLLADALAVFECDVDARHDAGDHVILVGRVVDFCYAKDGRPLVYHRGGYETISDLR